MLKGNIRHLACQLEKLSQRIGVALPDRKNNSRIENSRKALAQAESIYDYVSAGLSRWASLFLPAEHLNKTASIGLRLSEVSEALHLEDQVWSQIAVMLTDEMARLTGEVTENLARAGMLSGDHMDRVRRLDESYRDDRELAERQPLLAIANLVLRLQELNRLAREGNRLVEEAMRQAVPADLFAGQDADDADMDDSLNFPESEEEWFGATGVPASADSQDGDPNDFHIEVELDEGRAAGLSAA